ncbi:MAG: alpha/beta fold hydrolase [Pseudomonadota bacterium]
MSAARLACSVEGPENAPPVVLLHALATCRDLWLPQLPAWTTQFRVIRIDLPGHGESPLIDGAATIAGFADEVAKVLDGLGIERAAFVGLSLGGMVAQAFALKYPQRCSALVLAHTSARTDAPVRELWKGRLEQLEKDGLAAQAEAILGRWFPPAFAEASPMTLQWIASQIRATSPKGYAAAIRAIQQLDHLDMLKDIKAPTLVMAGEADMAAPPAAGALMAGQIANARLVVLPGVAHLGNVQAPVLFTETAGAFLQQALVP